MKLKIPPVFVVALCALLMWALNKYLLSDFNIHFEGQRIIARVFFGICVMLLLWAIGFFMKKGTTVDPSNPDKASSLVQSGIYRYTRNPMYLGMLFMLLAFAVKVGNPFNFLILVFFVWYMTKFQIKPEEEALTQIFGEEYSVYCKKVRRWLF